MTERWAIAAHAGLLRFGDTASSTARRSRNQNHHHRVTEATETDDVCIFLCVLRASVVNIFWNIDAWNVEASKLRFRCGWQKGESKPSPYAGPQGWCRAPPKRTPVACAPPSWRHSSCAGKMPALRVRIQHSRCKKSAELSPLAVGSTLDCARLDAAFCRSLIHKSPALAREAMSVVR